jgi:hemolysin D
MSDAGNGEAAAHPGLSALVNMLRFQGIGVDPAQLRHRPSAGTTTTPSEPKGQELVYAARVSLDRTQMQVEGSRVNLSPGMAVTAEIKTGSRTIISYLLSPLLEYRQESLRERCGVAF